MIKQGDCNITIIDALMGTGKSTFLIDKIINQHPEKRFLIVVPTKNQQDKNGKITKQGEIGRYMKEITAKTYEPKATPKKGQDLQRLIAKGVNIVTTHALIKLIDETSIDLLKKSNYTLIIDEALDVVHEYKRKFSRSDVKTILHDQWAFPDQDGFLIWNTQKEQNVFENNYKGRWDDIKQLCKLHSLRCLKKDDGTFSDKIVIWNMPPIFFRLFDECYIATYLWNGSVQKAYFDMFNIPYCHKSISNKILIDYSPSNEVSLRKTYFDLINLYDGHLNNIGIPDTKNRNPLNSSWYTNRKSDKNLYFDMLCRNTSHYFKNIVKTRSSENMWTVYKSYRSDISNDGYARGFVSWNTKGTNDYQHKISLVYLINLYPHPNLTNFFLSQGISLDQDLYALSEMLQWIFRSRIRNKQKINLYLPSSRMRGLLLRWAGGHLG